MSRHRRAGAPTIGRLSISGPSFPGFGPGTIPLAPPPIIPASPTTTAPGGGLCQGLPLLARLACEKALDFFDIDGDDGSDPLVDPGGCPPFMSPDPLTGQCRFDIDPGPGQGLPGGNGAAGGGLVRPSAVARTVLACPRFADGKTGILWMNALTGDVVCLPRRTSGRGFGLIRKNKPRKKAFISAAQKKSLDDIKKVQDKAKKFAMDAGFSCKKR